MSDRLEEIKSALKGTWGVNPDQVEWLIAEVERLSDAHNELLCVCIDQGTQIESLTKERDEYKGGFIHGYEKGIKNNPNEDEWRKLEAEYLVASDLVADLKVENAELKEEVKHEIEVSGRNVRLYRELEEKLAASKKVQRIKKLWNIAVKCNLCGAIFPDKHTGPCAL